MTPMPDRLEALVHAWSATADPTETVRQALTRTDDHPALALWAYLDDRIEPHVAPHRKIAAWTQTLRTLVPAETWRPAWVRLLDRLPPPLRMWVLRAWSRRWPPEADFWAGCLNEPTVLQWVLQWAQQDPAWRTWAAERGTHVRSERLRRKLLPAESTPPTTPTPAWRPYPTVSTITPMNGTYDWLIPYTHPATDAWTVLGLRTQADRTIRDAAVFRLEAEDRARFLGTPEPPSLSEGLLLFAFLRQRNFFAEYMNDIDQGRLRHRAVRLESAWPFLIEALERTPPAARPFYLRTYAAAFVEPWFRWDVAPEVARLRDLLMTPTLSTAGTPLLPFRHPQEAAAFLVHLFNVLWAYHPPEDATRLVAWLDEVTRGVRRPPFLERFIARHQGTVFAPVPPRLTPEVQRALAKAYVLTCDRPLDDTVTAGIRTLLTWTLADLTHWARSLAEFPETTPEGGPVGPDAPA